MRIFYPGDVLVFEAKHGFSKLSEIASFDELDCISIKITPFLYTPSLIRLFYTYSKSTTKKKKLKNYIPFQLIQSASLKGDKFGYFT